MTKSEYDAYNKDFDNNKKLLLLKGGRLSKRYFDNDFVYSEAFKRLFTVRIYHFDLHLEDLENGIAPESPGIFGGGFVR